MTKILMVCLGNICRSPLAHGIMANKLNTKNYYVDSAGTASYHIGSKPDRRSIEVALNHGIEISHQRARQFVVADFDEFDYIYVMDRSNLSNILSLSRDDEDAKKVHLFLESNPNISDKNVPDPYYGDILDFENVFNIVDETCDIIASSLED
ncbi:low molecular weight protein-tyrosine-phosphatase [Winogradskyella poriferorum]|uniref:low molecular weight protein-tyrosine-phosphatase n=1 Tax=Winogradskyella poriferorum TaxID=307627 RepID=UPI003D6537E5